MSWVADDWNRRMREHGSVEGAIESIVGDGDDCWDHENYCHDCGQCISCDHCHEVELCDCKESGEE